MVTCLDDEIGRVVAAIDKKGLRDNTLIIFHSDNGGTRNAMFAGQMADLSSTCGLIGHQMLRGCDVGLAVVAEAASPNNSDSVMRWRAVQ